jgi:hypothetical protein
MFQANVQRLFASCVHLGQQKGRPGQGDQKVCSGNIYYLPFFHRGKTNSDLVVVTHLTEISCLVYRQIQDENRGLKTKFLCICQIRIRLEIPDPDIGKKSRIKPES